MDKGTPERLIVGVQIEMQTRNKEKLPTAKVSVVRRGQDGKITAAENFRLVPRGSDLAEMLKDLGSSFANRVNGLAPGTVVVRRAEQPPRATKQEGPKRRLLAEGALVYAASTSGAAVVISSGSDLAKRSRTNKVAMDAAAESLVPEGDEEYIEAAAVAVLLLAR